MATTMPAPTAPGPPGDDAIIGREVSFYFGDDLVTGTVVDAESNMRWNDPLRRMLSVDVEIDGVHRTYPVLERDVESFSPTHE